MFKQLTGESKALVRNVIELVYYMRGSVQYDDMMWRTPFERDLMNDFVEKRLENESKKSNPVY